MLNSRIGMVQIAAAMAAMFGATQELPTASPGLRFQPANRRRSHRRCAGPAGVAGSKLAKRFAKGEQAPRGF
jgi:hypothetical protein